MMLVNDILRRKGTAVVTVEPDATVAEVVDLLGQHDVGALVVSTDGAVVSGIVSERDVVRGLRDAGAGLLALPVARIMTTRVIFGVVLDSVERAMSLMSEHGIRHLPIGSNGRLEGIISIGDVVKGRIGQLESDQERLLLYISAG
jgi:CBS domain-containing protein